MALGSYQKLTRVITGKPFGDGTDGDYSSATIPTMTVATAIGTSENTALTAGGTSFANNDIVLIWQVRGTGAGQWEVNKVASGGGTSNLVMSQNLNYSYATSGASAAQIVKIPQYNDVTVQSGTWTIPSWNGSTGGVLTFSCNGTLTVTGTISGVGGNGGAGVPTGAGATSTGFRGGDGKSSSGVTAYCGEGTGGVATQQTTANGNGGGGGTSGGGGGGSGGGGGGNATAGGDGDEGSNGGEAAGATDLTSLVLGGGGGGGGNDGGTDQAGGGGGGGAAVFIFAKTIAEVTGAITLTGGLGASPNVENGYGGSGAGGSCLIQAYTAILGTNKITAAGGASQGTGGAGSNGRIAIHYGSSTTGTTNPTISETSDSSLKEGGAPLGVIFI